MLPPPPSQSINDEAGEEELKRRISISSEVLAKAKLLGSINLTERGSVDVGTVYFGETKQGKVSVFNDTNRAVTIAGMSTSCGCTVAYPGEKQIPIGEIVPFMVAVSPSKLGEFAVQIKIKSSDKQVYPFAIQGKVVPLVSIRQRKLAYTADQEFLTVHVDINKPGVRAADVGLIGPSGRLNPLATKGRSVEFLVPTESVNPSVMLKLVPSIKSDPQSPVLIPARLEGHVRLVTRRAYYETVDGVSRFRLFVTGDMESIQGVTTGQINGESVPIVVKRLGNASVLCCELSACDYDGDEVSLALNEKLSLTFRLYRR